MRRALAAAALLGAATAARAAPANVGTAAADFLAIGAGARSLGLGGAYTALAEGPESIYWNPAGMAGMTGPEATYSLSQLPAGLTHNYAAVAAPVARLGGDLGFAFTSLLQPGLDLVTASDQNVGTFSPHSEAYALAYARRFSLGGAGVLDAGLAAKLVEENLGTRSAGTFAVDAGAILHPTLLPDLTVGAAVRSVGGKLNFIADSEPLPSEVGLSAAYLFRRDGWSAAPALDVSLPYAGDPYAKIGVELARPMSEKTAAFLRLGYTTQPAVSLGFVSGVTAGVGVRVNKFVFDAAFEPMSSLGDEYRLSVAWRF
jgi:hypothetical protein